MAQNTLVTDAKIKWLAEKGYITINVKDGATSYFVTELGKKYLNGTKED